mgnify:FL=1
MKEKISKIFEGFKKDYSQEDAEKVMANQSKIEQIMQNETLNKYIDDVKLYFKMLADIFTGKYKQIPVGTIAAIVGTLLYVLSPVDLLPDFLPGGFVDDAGIVALCLSFTKRDLEEYKAFKAQEFVVTDVCED